MTPEQRPTWQEEAGNRMLQEKKCSRQGNRRCKGSEVGRALSVLGTARKPVWIEGGEQGSEVREVGSGLSVEGYGKCIDWILGGIGDPLEGF